MALNTATFGGYTQTERSKMRHELGAYFKDHPEAYSDIPEAWLESYNEDQSDYLSASSEERREDWTGRPSQVDYIADYVLANSADPGVAQIVGSLPDIGEVAVGEQTADTKVYHGPTSLLGKIGQGIGMAGMAAGFGLAGAGLLNSAGLVGAVPGVGTGGATAGGATAGGATTFPGTVLGAGTPMTPLSAPALSGAGAVDLTSAIAGASNAAGTAGGAAFGASTLPQIASVPASFAAGATSGATAGAGLAANGLLAAGSSLAGSTPMVDNWTPADKLKYGVPTNYAPVVEKSVEAGTGWASSAPAAGSGLLSGLDAGDILTAGTLLAGAIGGSGGSDNTTTGEPFQFTPFDSTPVNAPETQRVFPQGGYYQQQANAMVPGGGQQMPTPEQYQGLLNSAFSRRV